MARGRNIRRDISAGGPACLPECLKGTAAPAGDLADGVEQPPVSTVSTIP